MFQLIESININQPLVTSYARSDDGLFALKVKMYQRGTLGRKVLKFFCTCKQVKYYKMPVKE